MTGWQAANQAAIEERLAPLLNAPDGVLHEERSVLHHIRVVKQGEQVHVYFVEPDGELAGPMSRIDLRRPLHLLAAYMQVALLALLWRPAPERVCVLGFGGGRLSLVLHHNLPDAVIDNVEIDAAFAAIAERFFGVAYDERQRLFIADARAHLVATPGARYDIVVMDAFRDGSDNLDRLATVEFYQLCAARLAPGGVFCANLLRSDPRLGEKLAALRASFRVLHVVERRRSLVALANDRTRLTPAVAAEAARTLERRHGFDFPLVPHAQALRLHRPTLGDTLPPLVDASA